MKRVLLVLAVPMLLSACQSGGGKETIAQLRSMKVEIKEERIEGGLDKAMESYRRFLEETPESALTPEAIRRLADLKVEKEYGYMTAAAALPRTAATALSAPESSVTTSQLGAMQPSAAPSQPTPAPRADSSEPQLTAARSEGTEDLEKAGAREAIALYDKLLKDYPLYAGNDQVLYQMSRAYEELGQTEDAMRVMDRMVRDFPRSRYLDEVQFRRAEYFFARRSYMEAEATYKKIVELGVASSYYELALYKLGWTFYKQELYEDGLHRFIALLDHKVATGYDFAQTADDLEKKRVDDAFRVISQSFSYLHGAQSVMEYFDANGKRSYEDRIYSNLGEFYFEKRRYADAAASYNAFVSRNPFHRVSPQFQMRVIDIHLASGFPTLVIEAKKEFAKTYGLKAEYWKHFDPASRPEVLGFLKTNFTDLAHHYHALYQDPEHVKEKEENFREALNWYEGFLLSFPQDAESPAINYQLADLLLENRSFARAAVEYEKTAYNYPLHEKAPAAGYAAIFAYREQLRSTAPEEAEAVKRETVRSSLKFAETYPQHEKAAVVLGAAAEDLYEMKDYEPALAAGRKLIAAFPGAAPEVLRSAWVVAGHSCYELKRFPEAEAAYVQVLALLPEEDKERAGFVDNLAASIYQQGELANAAKDYRGAADHFLRVGRMAATSKIRANAEYDAAVALIQLKEWKPAAAVLSGFRDLFPGHELQAEATRQIAYVYREDGQIAQAAEEYERVEKESQDAEVRKGALLLAAELHQEAGNSERALKVYRRYVGFFPDPVETNIETRNKIAEILKAQKDEKGYLAELKEMVAVEAAAGNERTPRTKFLAGKGALVLAERNYERFAELKLAKPFETNLRKKKELMKESTQAFNKLIDYEIGEVTAAATFYLAEIYGNFSKSLAESERPEGLDPQELEEYNLAIEEQAFPFEEKSIQVHEKNLELISVGIYNEWVDKSLGRLAKLVPARYDKPEAPTEIVASPQSYAFVIEKPAAPAAAPVAEAVAAAAAVETVAAAAPAPTAEGEAPAVVAASDAQVAPVKEEAAAAPPPAPAKKEQTTPKAAASKTKKTGKAKAAPRRDARRK